jgi:hypothetical protein
LPPLQALPVDFGAWSDSVCRTAAVPGYAWDLAKQAASSALDTRNKSDSELGFFLLVKRLSVSEISETSPSWRRLVQPLASVPEVREYRSATLKIWDIGFWEELGSFAYRPALTYTAEVQCSIAVSQYGHAAHLHLRTMLGLVRNDIPR